MKIVNVLNSRQSRRGLVCVTLALAASAATVGGAFAAEPGRSVRVNFADLDLRTPAGAQRLLARIEYAATAVCGDGIVPDLIERQRVRRCRAAAIDQAVSDADRPVLTALAHRSAAPLALAGG